MHNDLSAFIEQHEATIAPLSRDYSVKFWELSTNGGADKEKALIEAKERYLKVYSNADEFRWLRQKRSDAARLPQLQARQFKLIYDTYVPNQMDESVLQEMVRRETEIENEFNTFRADFENSKVTDNQLRDVLQDETNMARRKAAWEASKQVGHRIAPRLIELVKIRNTEARKLGYANYYSMMFELQELNEAQVFDLFDRLDALSAGAFREMKAKLDESLKKKVGITDSASPPWLYGDPFFQEFPAAGTSESLDIVFKGKNVESLTRRHYESIGLSIEDLLKSADLYEREGKSQHAFCLDIDHEGDIRVLCNIRDNERWMSTMLHEFGHAVYDKYNEPGLPFTLRTPAHILTTEAIAMLNGRMSKNPEWLVKIAELSESEATKLSRSASQVLRSEMLIFLRWALTLVRFERELYRNPDQNLNRLWWEYVARYQMVTPPSGRDQADWAAKSHLATSPAYYQNYVLGELMASQLIRHIHTEVVKAEKYVDQPEVGKFLVEKIFKPGARYEWSEMLKQATGEELNPEHFVRQFV